MKTNLHIFRIPLLLLLIVAACTKEKTPSLSIDGKTAYTLESGSVRLNIKLIANSADWTCDTGADWISLLSREAAQATLLVAENPGFDAREATVSFRAGQASALVAVTQAGKARTPFVEVSVTGNGDVDAAGATLTATVSSWPEEWEPEITSGSEILTIAKEEHTLKITVLPNTEDKPRSGRIRVWAPSKAAGLAFQDIAISQKPLDITYQETDLSETATSNCYLISHKGPYSFNAKVRGHGKTVTGRRFRQHHLELAHLVSRRRANGTLCSHGRQGDVDEPRRDDRRNRHAGLLRPALSMGPQGSFPGISRHARRQRLHPECARI